MCDQSATEHLNPKQTPVITFDQPLYALAKRIQWKWPEEYGESKFVIMFDGLHIEMAALKMLGDWLKGSGWVQALVQAEITTQGTADSFLKAAHVVRTRQAHQVTASALYIFHSIMLTITIVMHVYIINRMYWNLKKGALSEKRSALIFNVRELL